MADNIYVLDLLVTGADAVSVLDDGAGNDTIRVIGLYQATIDIDLAWTTVSGVPMHAGSRYYSAENRSHHLLIYGQIENAFGSNGTEFISGNDLANWLGGDQRRTGAGLSDTIWGGGGDDSVYGGSGDDALHGEADDDVLWGDAGNDTISCGSGADTVEGGAGADVMDGGGDAGDTLSYAAARRGVTVTLQAGQVTLGRGGEAEGDRISGFVNVTGTASRDVIKMVDKATLPGGQADNVVYGGGARDRITTGGGNDRVFGGSGNDKVLGEMGDDSLSGGAGQDWLSGGFGRDTLTGEAGADIFFFKAMGESAPTHADMITDFSRMEGDRIDLRLMDADTGLAGNQAFSLISGGFTGNAAELVQQVVGADMVVSADMTGDGMADFTILLQGVAAMTAADFIL